MISAISPGSIVSDEPGISCRLTLAFINLVSPGLLQHFETGEVGRGTHPIGGSSGFCVLLDPDTPEVRQGGCEGDSPLCGIPPGRRLFRAGLPGSGGSGKGAPTHYSALGSPMAPLPMVFSDTGRNPHGQHSAALDAVPFPGKCTWNLQFPPCPFFLVRLYSPLEVAPDQPATDHGEPEPGWMDGERPRRTGWLRMLESREGKPWSTIA